MINPFKMYRMYKEKENVLDTIYEYAGELNYFVTELRQTKKYHEYSICDPKNIDISLLMKVELSEDYDSITITTSYATAESLGKTASKLAKIFNNKKSVSYYDYRVFEENFHAFIVRSMDDIKGIRSIV